VSPPISNHPPGAEQVAFILTHQWRVIFGADSVAMMEQEVLLPLLIQVIIPFGLVMRVMVYIHGAAPREVMTPLL
jgi:hypothetical protein